MLTRLSIRNIVLIEKLDLDLAPGLAVLTGETGAGKSILLDSLGLGLGARGDTGLLRQGADQASVALTFSLPQAHAAFEVLESLGLEADSHDALILRRTVGRDGRSRAFINDQPVQVGALKKVGESLVDIHGQFEAHGLLNRDTHMDLLDAFAGIREDVKELGLLFSAWKEAEAAYSEARQQAGALQQQAEYIHASIEDLITLSPVAGEAEKLAEKRTWLQGREKIMEALAQSAETLRGEGGGAEKLAVTRRILSRAAEKAPGLLEKTLAKLEEAESAAAEAAENLDKILHDDDFDAAILENAEERLFALRAAARKYQCQPNELADILQRFKNQAGEVQDGTQRLKKLEDAAQKAGQQYTARSASVHKAREKAATELEKAVGKELPPLKLAGARFSVALDRLAPEESGPKGISRVVFLAAINPGVPAAPLHKVASGGELARFMLAIRLCLAEDAVSTLVFDEVDTGIGGATADAVGERLARLGRTRQTLVVTHSPQVAARGKHHWRVDKISAKDSASTRVNILEATARLEEIARMLAGQEVTDAARAAAASLLAGEDEAEGTKKRRKAS